MAIENIRLIQGDFFKKHVSIASESVDFVFADPPYFLSSGGMSVSSGRQVNVDKGDWDLSSGSEMENEFHRHWVRLVREKMKPDATIVVSGTHHSIFKCGRVLEEAGFKILNDIAWFKPNGAPNLSGRRLAASHETLIWAAKTEKSKFVFNYEFLKYGDYPMDKIKKPGKQMRSVWWIPSTPKSEKALGGHPTQKPVALLSRVISAFTDDGALVLDPFMGSGTAGVVAKEMGRSFVGVEKSPEYFRTAKRRIEAVAFD